MKKMAKQTAPRKDCRNCGKRISVRHDFKYEHERDENGRILKTWRNYSGAFSYRVSEFFCSYDCGYRFAVKILRRNESTK